MTKDQVIAAAREAGFANQYPTGQMLDMLGKLYAIAYRQALEDASNIVQANAQLCATGGYGYVLLASNAAAIRALKDKP